MRRLSPLHALLASLALLFTAHALAAAPEAPATSADGGTPDAGWDVNAPPLPGHDATIDVTEGTWMSVDVSPRGDAIAFDLLGDLYTVPMSGGEARALTSGAAWDMQPRFSPDGASIAFTSDRGGGDNIWVLPLDGGTPTQVTKEKVKLMSSPAWSPDGRFLVARKHFTSRRSLGAGEIWLMHRSGGEGVQLTERPNDQKDVGEPAFSPDGRSVYYSQDVTPGSSFEYNKDANGQIYVINRYDLEKREVTRFVTGPGGSIRPTPSPDGKLLAFVRRVRAKSVLMLADVASGAERELTDGLDRDLQETWAIHGVAPAMAWTRDSRALVFSAKGKLWRIDVGSKRITNIPFHVKSTRRVFDTVRFTHEVAPAEAPLHLLRWAQVAPTGRQVVYEALGVLWTRALPDGAPKRLTRSTGEREAYPSFSRDGRSVVYVSWDDEQLGRIRIVPSSGGTGREVLKTPGHYVQPALSPDGKFVVYRAVSGGGLVSALWGREPGLYVVPVSGGAPRRLSPEGSEPHFGPERDRVYFLTVDSSGKEDVRALKSIRLDGSEEQTHLTSDEATEYRVSPDGKWLAWRENFNAFVMPFVRGAKGAVASPDSKALPVAKVSKDAGEWLHWSADSKRLHWSLGSQLYTRELTDAFAFLAGAPQKRPEPPTKGRDIGFVAKSDVVKGTVAFVGGRILTMQGDSVVEDGTLVATDGRITAVGPRATTKVPGGARVIDVKGKTLMPGLVDVHWHGALSEDGIVPEQNWMLLAGLAFGVTTIHDPSNDTDGFFAASELQRTGALVGPRLFSTGTILYGAQGSFRAVIDSLDDARGHLRRLKAAGAFSVKSYNQPRREQRQMVIKAAHEVGMLVVPEGGSLLMHNLTQVVDGHTTIEHAVPVEAVYEDVKQLWSQAGTAYTPTLEVAYGGLFGENYWYAHTEVWKDPRLTTFVPRRVLDARARRPLTAPPEEWNHIHAAEVAASLAQRGVRVNIGAHGQREGLAAHWELWGFVQGGMTPMQALHVGTINGATSLGMEKDLGSLEVGKLADVLVLDGNPLEDIRKSREIRYTVLGGRVYDAATMNEVWPKPGKRPPLYFQREGGEAWPPGAAASDAHGESVPCE